MQAGHTAIGEQEGNEPERLEDGERLALSPQCGFASTVAGNPITEADMRAKLALVVEGARAIWG